MGKNLKYGEFEFPSGGVTYVKGYARGGMVHSDAKQDKGLIKKAVGMHDTQLHGGKHTNLTKLSHGGRVHGYAAGGSVTMEKPAAVMKPRGPGGSKSKMAKPAMGGALGAMAAKSGPMMKVGGMVRKASMNMSPKSRTDSPPKSVNVKARMSLGAAGSPENLAGGGFVKKMRYGGKAC